MPTLLTALSLGTVSLIIVFISGFMSGVVRLGTLSLRALFAFCMTSAASYFLMMLFDLYDDLKLKKMQKLAAELEAESQPPPVEKETPVEVEGEEPASVPPPPPAANFQPLDASNLPNVGK